MLPSGALRASDGTIMYPDGAERHTVVTLPSGEKGPLPAELFSDPNLQPDLTTSNQGVTTYPSGTSATPDGKLKLSNGKVAEPKWDSGTGRSGEIQVPILPSGAIKLPGNRLLYPDGSVLKPDGNVLLANGKVQAPEKATAGQTPQIDKTFKLPDGGTRYPSGTTVTASGAVLGPSGNPETLIWSPTDGPAEATLFPSGVLKLPNGQLLYPDGSNVAEEIKLPNGSTKAAQRKLYPGEVAQPDNTIRTAEGATKYPSGAKSTAKGKLWMPDGSVQEPKWKLPTSCLPVNDSTSAPEVLPTGSLKFPDGKIAYPDGSVRDADGAMQLPDGSLKSNWKPKLLAREVEQPDSTVRAETGAIRYPSGASSTSRGKLKLPDGTILEPKWALPGSALPGGALSGANPTAELLPSGALKTSAGKVAYPDGSEKSEQLVLKDGTVATGVLLPQTPDRTSSGPDGVLFPSGATLTKSGVLKGPNDETLDPLWHHAPGEAAEVYPSGAIVFPDGRALYPDGSVKVGDNVHLPNGEVVKAVSPQSGEMVQADGSILTPDGNTLYPSGAKTTTDGRLVLANGSVVSPRWEGADSDTSDRVVQTPAGALKLPDGKILYPDGSLVKEVLRTPDGKLKDLEVKVASGEEPQPDRTVRLADGSIRYPSGATTTNQGKLRDPQGGTVEPKWKLPASCLPSTAESGQFQHLPSGSIKTPYGSILYPDGSVKKPGQAAVTLPDGSLKPLPTGAGVQSDFTTRTPTGAVVYPSGAQATKNGNLRLPDNSVVQPMWVLPVSAATGQGSNTSSVESLPSGALKLSDGTTLYPDGSVKFGEALVLPSGQLRAVKPRAGPGEVMQADGSVITADGSLRYPSGASLNPAKGLVSPTGSPINSLWDVPVSSTDQGAGVSQLASGALQLPSGSILYPDGSVRDTAGTLKLADGTIVPHTPLGADDKLQHDHTARNNAGRTTFPSGAKTTPEGLLAMPDGTVHAPKWKLPSSALPGGGKELEDRQQGSFLPSGSLQLTDGTVIYPDGSVKPSPKISLPKGGRVDKAPVLPGDVEQADKTSRAPDGTIRYPTGTQSTPSGKLLDPSTGAVVEPKWGLPSTAIPRGKSNNNNNNTQSGPTWSALRSGGVSGSSPAEGSNANAALQRRGGPNAGNSETSANNGWGALQQRNGLGKPQQQQQQTGSSWGTLSGSTNTTGSNLGNGGGGWGALKGRSPSVGDSSSKSAGGFGLDLRKGAQGTATTSGATNLGKKEFNCANCGCKLTGGDWRATSSGFVCLPCSEKLKGGSGNETSKGTGEEFSKEAKNFASRANKKNFFCAECGNTLSPDCAVVRGRFLCGSCVNTQAKTHGSGAMAAYIGPGMRPLAGVKIPQSSAPAAQAPQKEEIEILTFYPYDMLKQLDKLPQGVKPHIREQYLDPEAFEKLFGMDKDKFKKLAVWKQKQLKQRVALF